MKKTILVVDDRDGVRYTLEGFLAWVGYNVLLCEDGEHAISYINQADLLITDFNMPPGMNGAELTKIAKREKPNLPVIIMTGEPENIPVDHLADKVVEKPFDTKQLEKIIASILKEEGGRDD